MKKAGFITAAKNLSLIKEAARENIKYNSYEYQLEPYEGILNIKRGFSFKPDSKVRSVTVRAAALGIFDLFVNGKRVGVKENGETVYDELKPGWTDYRCRVFEYEYDITEYCGENNVFTAQVSSGWWSGRISFGFYGNRECAFAGEIEIGYEDGSTELIASGDDWLASVGGPVMRADIWDGEYYDSTKSVEKWENAVLFDGFKGEIVPLVGPKIRVKKELTRIPQSATVHEGTTEDGSTYGTIKVLSKKIGFNCEKTVLKRGQAMILDMGQDMVGRPVIEFKAERNTKITVYFAEMLNDSGEESRGNDGAKGSMYIKNYRSALARLVYVASGNGCEKFFPTHVFFGFRYLEIRADADIEIISVKGEVIGSDVRETAGFTCDDPEVNKLYSNIVWGMRGNYLSVPTDCPQRDERLGWTGDTQIFCGTASYLADIDSFMKKWLGDVRDSQKEYGGAYCDVIPRIFTNPKANAAWGDAGIIVPYYMWLMYGNTDIIAEHYASMEEYMRYLEQFGYEGANTAYGDWLNYDVTDSRYIAVSYYAYDAELMAFFSKLLGKNERYEYYGKLRGEIVNHWRARYISGDDLICKTQTAYLLALAFDLLPENMVGQIAKKLREAIENNGHTLSTGFVGTGVICKTLARAGLDDLCYDLLLQTHDPSWLYSVRQGATTVWERWNSYTVEKGFGNVSMNSFNHYAYGAVAEWLFSGMCGIAPDKNAPGFGHFILRPTPDMRTGKKLPSGQKNIRSASAYYDSRAGRIESSWNRGIDNTTEYSFTIPHGTSASAEIISASDTLEINGVTFTAEELNGCRAGDRICFALGEGKYTITVKMPE